MHIYMYEIWELFVVKVGFTTVLLKGLIHKNLQNAGGLAPRVMVPTAVIC